MTMNSSGPISLGGSVTGQSINLEILQTATTQVSLNDSKVRTLAQVPSGPITMATNFWGKKYAPNSSTVFLVGGGGLAGGGGSGGGGGQVITPTSVTGLSGTYTVVVGAAGSGSSVFGITAVAGGNGGSGINSFTSCVNGTGTVTGGGASGSLTPAGTCAPGYGSVSRGGFAYVSGYPNANALNTGGGGGLGGNGGDATADYGGNGGASTYSTFNYAGSVVRYSGGSPGICFAGSGYPCTNGNWADGGYGANTGYGTWSGVVILVTPDSFPQCPTTGSPSIVHSGGYYWYTFNGSGTITF